MSLKCAYHPNRNATDKCEKCGKVICPECKMVDRETHYGGTGDSSYAYSTGYDYCPVCFYDKKIRKYSFFNYLGAIIITIGVIVYIIIIMQIFGGFGEWAKTVRIFDMILFSLPIILVVALDINNFIFAPIKARKKNKRFTEKKLEFLNSLESAGLLYEEKQMRLHCPECGNKLDPGTSVCSYCGGIIKV